MLRLGVRFSRSGEKDARDNPSQESYTSSYMEDNHWRRLANQITGEFAAQLLIKNGHPRRQAQTSVFFNIRVIKLVLLTLLKLMPLKVIVVGAGIGGICAATSLRQAGHDVEVGSKDMQGFLSCSSSSRLAD